MTMVRLVLIATAIAVSGGAGAAPSSAFNSVNSFVNAQCRSYGYAPGTRAFAQCRQNVRIYWNTGPCSRPEFAAVHLRYCNIAPEIDF